MRTIATLLLVAGLMAGESDYQGPDDKAMLGVTMAPPSSTTQAKNGIDADTGVEVSSVYGGTAAETMGLQPGDVIKDVNGSAITSMTDLRNEVALTGVGGQVDLVVLRDGQPVAIGGTLGEWPKSIPYQPIDATAERRFRDWQSRRLERSQLAVAAMSRQVEALERKINQPAEAVPPRIAGSLTPLEATALPLREALAGLPAWKLSLRTGYDSKPAPGVPPAAQAPIAWDARILLGTPAPEIL